MSPFSFLTIDGVADFVDDYVYDSLGRVTSVVEHGVTGGNAVATKEIDLAYNDAGQIVSIDRYEDGQLAVEGDYSYDSFGRLVGLVYHQGDTILNSYAWTYSGESGVASGQWSVASDGTWTPTGGLMPIYDTSDVTAALMSGGLAGLDLLTSCTSIDGTAVYSYDPTGQLAGATYSNSALADESYSYDANGNRVTANGYVYTTGADNRLLSDGTYYYEYDAEGNRVARWIDVDADGVLDAGDTEVTAYTWDNRNRLVEVTDYDVFGGDATQIVDYFYDVENRWIGENIDSNGDGVVDHQLRFAYDGNQIVLQFEKDGDGAVTGENLSHRYLWQANAVDQLMADEQVTDVETAGDVVWPLADQQGTIRDLAVCSSQTGITSVVNHRVFDSFGNLKSAIDPLTNRAAAVDCLFGFTGRALDKNTNSQYNTTRWYDPKVGRWESEDWIGFLGRDTNPNRYCGNDPINKTDPSGEIVPIVVGAVVAGVWWFFTPNVANAPGPGDPIYPADPLPNPLPALEAGAMAGSSVGLWRAVLARTAGRAAAGTAAAGTITSGGATAEIVVTRTIAKITITLTRKGDLTAAFVRTIITAARQAGAKTAVVSTGLVLNSDLAARLSALAASGGTYLGGRVVQVAGGPIPIFEIIFDTLPNL